MLGQIDRVSKSAYLRCLQHFRDNLANQRKEWMSIDTKVRPVNYWQQYHHLSVGISHFDDAIAQVRSMKLGRTY